MPLTSLAPETAMRYRSVSLAILLAGLGFAPVATAFDGKYGVKATESHTGPCPATLWFEAWFYGGQAGAVEFIWTRSDGVELRGERLELTLAKPNMYTASSAMYWEVSTDRATGQEFWVSVRPVGATHAERSRPVSVVCREAADGGALDSSEANTATGGVEADAELWELGNATTTVVIGEADAVEPESVVETRSAPPPSQRMTTRVYRCPESVEIGAVARPGEGWSPSWEPVVVPFTAQMVHEGTMTCLYQQSPLTVPANMKVPANATECVPSGRGFVCRVPE